MVQREQGKWPSTGLNGLTQGPTCLLLATAGITSPYKATWVFAVGGVGFVLSASAAAIIHVGSLAHWAHMEARS